VKAQAQRVDEEAYPVMGRRDWLLGVAGAYLALSVPLAFDVRTTPCYAANLASWLRETGTGLFANPATLRELGRAYLASHAHERDLRILSQLLLDKGSTAIQRRLIERIALDWQTHDIVLVEGWVVARTEGRLCAALHLLDGAQA
jgi:hypothetical protein